MARPASRFHGAGVSVCTALLACGCSGSGSSDAAASSSTAAGAVSSAVGGNTSISTSTGGIGGSTITTGSSRPQPSGGVPNAGGATTAATGGANQTGGIGVTFGGSSAGGGAEATGGMPLPSGGTTALGGTAGTATGAVRSGGTSSTGGAETGGVSLAGAPSGGTSATGSSQATGSSKSTGGNTTTGGSTAIDGPATFHCVNWADQRDNFVNGVLQLSGLSSNSDTYATVETKANAILSEFQTKLGANAIRIPINEPTVSSSWWNAYKAVIDTAVSKNLKVVVAYWAYQKGMPDDSTAFMSMWQTVVTAYQSNNLVYFDIHNEPYGYGSAWNDTAAAWLAKFPSVPRGRVIIAGTGYDDNVNPVGSDSRFAGCMLELHIYGFWHETWTTQTQWATSMNSALGNYASRTLVGEWGAPMTTGVDYSVNADGDTFRSYVRAVSDILHNKGMGSCYWPGLRTADSYSMTTLNTNTSPPTLAVTNASGLDRLKWAWVGSHLAP